MSIGFDAFEYSWFDTTLRFYLLKVTFNCYHGLLIFQASSCGYNISSFEIVVDVVVAAQILSLEDDFMV